jgi:hypothetical protein
MASIVLSSLGSSLGNNLLPGVGGRILGGFGRVAGQNLDRQLGLRQPLRDGPRLDNLKVHDSRYGLGIPLAFGQTRVAGNVIWASDLLETTQQESFTGGKGGALGAVTGSRTVYSYSLHLAVAICAGPIGGISTIWADNKVIYQDGAWQDGIIASASFYNGTTAQSPDPLLQSYLGVGQAPAYQGLAYLVIEGLQLGPFGNRLPNLSFETVPANSAPQPSWLGDTDTGLLYQVDTARFMGMPPLILQGGSGTVRQCLIGGFIQVSGSSYAFKLAAYDVSGDVPAKLYEAQSASFTVNAAGDHSWALSPDGRFVALQLQDIGGTPNQYVALYDTATRQFGTVLSLAMGGSTLYRQIAWLDAQHFMLMDVSGTKRGVRVLARAGTGIIDLGFQDVWGSGSVSANSILFYCQFTPIQGGWLNYTTLTTGGTLTIYVRALYWLNGTLSVSSAYTLASSLPLSTGSGTLARLLRTADDEWTLFYALTSEMRLISFRPTAASAVITRTWQRLVNSSFSFSTTSQPLVYGDRIVVLQRSVADNNYRLSEIALNSSSFTLISDGIVASNFTLARSDFGAFRLDSARLLVLGVDGFDSTLTQLGILRRRTTGDSLAVIAGSLLTRAGYTTSDYDLTALTDIAVDGYVLNEPVAASRALVPLQLFARFDLVESDGKLKAVLPTTAPAVTLATTETVVSAGDKNYPAWEQRRRQELELPRELIIDHFDAARNYEAGSQRARRLTSAGAVSQVKFELLVVCSAAKAKQLAETRLFEFWAERDEIILRLSRRWLTLDIGDVISYAGRLLRITASQFAKGVLTLRGTVLPPQAIGSAAQADAGQAVAVALGDQMLNALYLLDLPLLRAEDDQPGCYAAMSGVAGWPGGSLWRAADGVSFSRIADFPVSASAGFATTALGVAATEYLDRANSVTVQLLQGSLASCSDTELLNGANVALLGSELIQFQTATLLGPGLYRLSNLLRGRRGSESAISTHSIGEKFLLLTPDTVQFLPALLGDRNRSYAFRGVTRGHSVGLQPDQAFTYGLSTLQPLAPAQLKGQRVSGTGSDLTLSWVRRARRNADWIDYVDVPLDEDREAYDIEIMNGSAVIRSFLAVTSTTQLYSAAQQSADWGTVPAQFTVNVYQLSSRYGRGQKATAIL